MKINFDQNRRFNRPGYLLIESMISLIICTFAIWTIMTMINFVTRAFEDQTTNFYAFIDLLESDHFRFQIVKATNDDVLLYSPVTKKRYHMEQYQTMIRFTGNHLGHVPILINVQKVCWKKSAKGVTTSVTFKNGEKNVAYSKLSTTSNK